MKKMGKIVSLIPARSGSKGVKDKNIRSVAGKSLLERTIKASLESRLIDRTIISTDSENYAELARAAGGEVPFLRPSNLSGDNSTDIEFVTHAMKFLSNAGEEPVYIIHLRPTTPLRDPKVLDSAIKEFLKKPEATALRSVHEMSETAYKCLEISKLGLLKLLGSNNTNIETANEARQSFPKTYVPNGYIDILKVDFIKNNHALHGDHVLPFFTEPALEVDTDSDLDYLEYFIKHILKENH